MVGGVVRECPEHCWSARARRPPLTNVGAILMHSCASAMAFSQSLFPPCAKLFAVRVARCHARVAQEEYRAAHARLRFE